MEILELFLNIDKYLSVFISEYGTLVYIILFLIIFAETGLVVFPFLPGDSLLFIIGAFAAEGTISIEIILFVLFIAASLGNIVNYHIGNFIGPKIFNYNIRFLNKESLEKTKEFYEKHGGKAIIISRFLPILRTFVPFIAGIGKMGYWKFIIYNLAGAALWVLSITLAGYFFGNIPFIKNNLESVIVGILVISIFPSLVEYLKYRKRAKKEVIWSSKD